jgi:hypothetical protein
MEVVSSVSCFGLLFLVSVIGNIHPEFTFPQKRIHVELQIYMMFLCITSKISFSASLP